MIRKYGAALMAGVMILTLAVGVGLGLPGTGETTVQPAEEVSIDGETDAAVAQVSEPSAGESFVVSDLDAPEDAVAGETVTVSANITNPNDAPLIQNVEFRLEGDVVERRGWALNPGETERITFEVNTTGLDTGTYIHGIETRDSGEVATIELDEDTSTDTPTTTPNETATDTPTATPNETATGTPTATPNETTTDTSTDTPAES